ncbi:MAG: signal recognition particle-docking protein FtsY [Alphaproteobacteria bacterium]|nr:signal recognition particle-docking protein FtsY [Alphaproteobacteria bacterium]
MRWLDKLKQGLKKTASVLSFASVDVDELEEALILSDMGVETVSELVNIIKNEKPKTPEEMKAILKRELNKKIDPIAKPLVLPDSKPVVILMVGVNGAGKTTTIGKLAAQYRKQGKTVACVAGDTFRAGAVEQLKKWAEKPGTDFYCGAQGCDAAGLIFDAIKTAKQKGTDIVFIDTAGRLQNRTDLMDELKKIVRVIRKIDDRMPHETILVLDATVGQNAISQVKIFNEVCSLSGLIMTKLDGTAKGGVLVALSKNNLPVYAVGVGEDVEDLNAFAAQDYVSSLLGEK